MLLRDHTKRSVQAHRLGKAPAFPSETSFSLVVLWFRTQASIDASGNTRPRTTPPVNQSEVESIGLIAEVQKHRGVPQRCLSAETFAGCQCWGRVVLRLFLGLSCDVRDLAFPEVSHRELRSACTSSHKELRSACSSSHRELRSACNEQHLKTPRRIWKIHNNSKSRHITLLMLKPSLRQWIGTRLLFSQGAALSLRVLRSACNGSNSTQIPRLMQLRLHMTRRRTYHF